MRNVNLWVTSQQKVSNFKSTRVENPGFFNDMQSVCWGDLRPNPGLRPILWPRIGSDSMYILLRILTSLNKSQQVSTSLNKSQQVSTSLNKSQQVSTSLNKSQQVSIDLPRFWKFSYVVLIMLRNFWHFQNFLIIKNLSLVSVKVDYWDFHAAFPKILIGKPRRL